MQRRKALIRCIRCLKNSCCVILLIFSNYVSAQKGEVSKNAVIAQHKLLVICQKLFHSTTNISDAEKQKYNTELLQQFEEILNEQNSFNYPFDSLKTEMAILNSPDNKFRIINWNVPKDEGTQEYFGFIQTKFKQVVRKGLFKKEHTEIIQIFPLIDKSEVTKNPENYTSDNKKWYGMLYNKIILKKTKTTNYYTLLAWDGNDKFSSKKIIDVLTFDLNGIPHFGAEVFNMQKKHLKRVIFEYASSCSMSLRFDNKKDSIIFDHLAPTSPQLEGQYQYYCSDMSYDGFGFKKGKWNYGTDVNATNEKDEKDILYNDPHDKGVPIK